MNRRQVLIGLGAASGSSVFVSSAFAQTCSPTAAEYFGDRNFRWLSDGRHMQLLNDFGYRDGCGEVWLAPGGIVVDGASIPRSLWSIIGSPFSGLYRDASVIHDHFCVIRNRPWRRVHRVFYEAMLTSGVNRVQARVMYAAVRLFGPRWQVIRRALGGASIMSMTNGANAEQNGLSDFRTGLAELAISNAIGGELLSAGLASDDMSILSSSLPIASDVADGEARSLRSVSKRANERGILTATVLGLTADRQSVEIELFEEGLPDSFEFEQLKDQIEIEDLDEDQIDAIAD